MSAADRKQAELFTALLNDHRDRVAQDIAHTTAAAAHQRETGDTLAAQRLRQALQHMSRRRNELDRLCDQLHRRLNTTPTDVTGSTRQFDIVVTRRRTGWRMEIPRFNVVLANIDSRAEAEEIGRSLIAAVTGFPAADIVVRALVG